MPAGALLGGGGYVFGKIVRNYGYKNRKNIAYTDTRARGTMLASTLPRSRIIPGPKANMLSSQSVRARLLPATGQRVTEVRQGFYFCSRLCVAPFLETFLTEVTPWNTGGRGPEKTKNHCHSNRESASIVRLIHYCSDPQARTPRVRLCFLSPGYSLRIGGERMLTKEYRGPSPETYAAQ